MSLTAPPYPQGKNLLQGKSVVVTAAAGTGIGFAVARRCAEEGARVVLSDVHDRRLGEAAERLEAIAGRRPPTVRCDVTVEADVQRLLDTAVAAEGRVDVMINNAGLGGTANLVDMTDEQWTRVLDVTLNGTFRCTRAALRHMMPRRSGAIVNNASVLGWRAQAGQAHYAAAKAGVMALTRCAAMEAAPSGVRVNAVAPSLAMHPFLARVTTPELLRELEAREAFGRAAEPWEVANVMVFLASDYASYMTGEIVAVSSQATLEEDRAMVDKAAMGAVGAPFTMDVERGKIHELARAVHASEPAYFTGDHPVAPPTFLTTMFFWEGAGAGQQPLGAGEDGPEARPGTPSRSTCSTALRRARATGSSASRASPRSTRRRGAAAAR